MSDSHLKALSRWKSDAYLKYVHLSPKDWQGYQTPLHPVKLEPLLPPVMNQTVCIRLSYMLFGYVAMECGVTNYSCAGGMYVHVHVHT